MKTYLLAAFAVTVFNSALACEPGGPWEIKGAPEIRADSCRVTLVQDGGSAPVSVTYPAGATGHEDCTHAKNKDVWLGRCLSDGKMTFVPLNIKG
jgi:hypothetical protein